MIEIDKKRNLMNDIRIVEKEDLERKGMKPMNPEEEDQLKEF